MRHRLVYAPTLRRYLVRSFLAVAFVLVAAKPVVGDLYYSRNRRNQYSRSYSYNNDPDAGAIGRVGGGRHQRTIQDQSRNRQLSYSRGGSSRGRELRYSNRGTRSTAPRGRRYRSRAAAMSGGTAGTRNHDQNEATQMNVTRHAVLGAIVAAALCVGCETTGTTSGGAAPAAMQAASAQDAGAAGDDLWALTSRPGPGHRILDALAGTWTATVRVWEVGRDQPKTLTGTVTREWILGERYLHGRPSISGPDGAIEGLSLIGYNVFDGVYEFVWVEDQRTSIAFDTGRYDERRKRFTFRGTLRDHTSGYLLETRTTYDVGDPDRHEVTGYTTDQNGVEERGFVVVFERVAP